MFVAGGLGANPHPALALEEFTAKEELLPTIESVLRVFEQTGNRDNKLRARLKWVVDELGFDELRRRVLKTRQFLLASLELARRHPRDRPEARRRPRRRGRRRDPHRRSVRARPSSLRGTKPYERWVDANVVRGVAKGTVSAIAYARLGDITTEQFRALASTTRELGLEVRLTNRQNIAFRGLTESQLPTLYARLEAIGMAEPGAELARDVVACPGADTCNLAVTQSRGLADAIGAALEEAGLAEVGGVRTNISGCTNSCGQHHVVDIGFFGAERRAHGQSAPGYQMLLGGYVGQEQMEFGEKALRLPASNAPEATVRVVRRFAERAPGRRGRSAAGSTAPAGSRRSPTRCATSTCSPPRRGPRLLRRLRRDRALRSRDRRFGVRDMTNATVFTGAGGTASTASPSPPRTSPTPSWPS